MGKACGWAIRPEHRQNRADISKLVGNVSYKWGGNVVDFVPAASVAQLVERHGKPEVRGSNPGRGYSFRDPNLPHC